MARGDVRRAAFLAGPPASIPFFAEFQSLLGAITGVPTLCGWPALFLLRGSAVRQEKVGLADKLACMGLLGVLLPALLFLGSASALASITRKWGGVGSPLEACINGTFQ